MAVVELNPSLFLADALLVKRSLGVLSNILIFENDESRTGSLTVILFDEDVTFSQVSKSFKEGDYFFNCDSVRKTSHDDTFLFVVVRNVFGESDVVTSTDWSVESQVIAIRDNTELDVSGSNMASLHFIHSFLGVII